MIGRRGAETQRRRIENEEKAGCDTEAQRAQRRKKIVKEKKRFRCGGAVQRPGALRPEGAGQDLAGGAASSGAAGRSGAAGKGPRQNQRQCRGRLSDMLFPADSVIGGVRAGRGCAVWSRHRESGHSYRFDHGTRFVSPGTGDRGLRGRRFAWPLHPRLNSFGPYGPDSPASLCLANYSGWSRCAREQNRSAAISYCTSSLRLCVSAARRGYG
jgi:hypothetical protein